MPIKCKANVKKMDAILKKIADIVKKQLETTLSYLGEQCVVRIKDRSAEESWIDQTGNLRSSIGYAVLDYGKKVIESSFGVVLNGTEGPQESRNYIDELAVLYSKTYALVVVAGMSYADYVEAIDGKDVLASTSLWAKAKVDEYVKRAEEKAIKEINKLLAA